MYDYKRIMVALDFSDMDEVLVKYTAFISKILEPEKIYFINIQKYKDLDVPDEIKAEIGDAHLPKDEQMEEEMRKLAIKHFDNVSHYNISYEVELGDPLKELLEWTHIKEIDLVIAGRKKEMSGSGLVVQHLARKIMSSLLLVPENAEAKMDKILVPTDFSDHSKMAMEAMIYLREKNSKVSTTCQHVFTLPSGYYTTGKSEAEFSDIMRGHAEKKYNEFKGKVDFKGQEPEILYTLDDDRDPSDVINEAAHNINADLIIMGARGRTDATSFLLGSKTEKLIAYDADIPLLVVKSKDKSFNFFDVLKSI